MMKMRILSVLSFLAVVASSVRGDTCKAQHSCKLEDLGCFSDRYQRALPEQILNERDTTSKVFNGRTIDWVHFSKWLSDFACRCTRKASEKGYTVIGLQFYGECWSGPDGETTYKKYGRSQNCVDGRLRSFSNATSNECIQHVGRTWTNHVYRIGTPGCSRHQIEPIGCFHDDLKPPRPVPHYIMNERDYSHKGWNGHLIDWTHWEKYSPQMICRCAEAASKKGHEYFAIQFYGECWSGSKTNVRTTYNRNGASTDCVNEYFQECKCNSYNCVGKAYTNYVYKLHGNVKCHHQQQWHKQQ